MTKGLIIVCVCLLSVVLACDKPEELTAIPPLQYWVDGIDSGIPIERRTDISGTFGYCYPVLFYDSVKYKFGVL